MFYSKILFLTNDKFQQFTLSVIKYIASPYYPPDIMLVTEKDKKLSQTLALIIAKMEDLVWP